MPKHNWASLTHWASRQPTFHGEKSSIKSQGEILHFLQGHSGTPHPDEDPVKVETDYYHAPALYKRLHLNVRLILDWKRMLSDVSPVTFTSPNARFDFTSRSTLHSSGVRYPNDVNTRASG